VSVFQTKGGDYIQSLVSGYSSDARAAKLLVMFQAFIDDSTSDKGDRRLFLAGYINTADNWTLFSDAWKEELCSDPAIDYLKMTEAQWLRGEFRGWSAEDRDKKLRGLARVIRHFQPVSIHYSVSRNEVNEIIKPVAPYGFASPYFYCFNGIILPLATQQAKYPIKVPIDFIFDNQEGLGEEVRFIYKCIRDIQPKTVRDMLSVDPLFRDDKQVLPLQAADMLAWHVRRQYESGEKDKWFVPDYLSVDDRPHFGGDIDATHLRAFAEKYSKVRGAEKLRSRSAWKETMKKMQNLESQGIDTSKIKSAGIYYPRATPIIVRAVERVKRLFRRK
jgi:Protein of unknown function (DUF3800)